MSRKNKQGNKEEVVEIKQDQPLVELSRAVLVFAGEDKEKKEHLHKYRDALSVYARKKIPSMMATQEDWNKVFKKF